MRIAAPVMLMTAMTLAGANPASAQDALPPATAEQAGAARAQDAAVTTQAAFPAAQASAPTIRPKRSFAEKAAIAAGTIGAAMSAFAALKALTKPKIAAPATAEAPLAQPVAAAPF